VIILGIDPDLHSTGFAVVADGKEVMLAQSIKVPAKRKGLLSVESMSASLQHVISLICPAVDLAVIEMPVIRQGSNSRPNDLMRLAAVAGAAAAACFQEVDRVRLVEPATWKGQVPKNIHQARIYEHLGWMSADAGAKAERYRYPLDPPSSLAKILKGDWKHIGDAIGLAIWPTTIKGRLALK